MTAVLAASILAVVAITTPFAYASTESETETEQELKQKNVGSGDSTNFNCGQNLINVPTVCRYSPVQTQQSNSN